MDGGGSLGCALATAAILVTAALALPRLRKARRESAHDPNPNPNPLAAHPSVRREMAKKQRLREKALSGGAAIGARDSSSVCTGLPEGQTLAKKWIVLDLGAVAIPSVRVRVRVRVRVEGALPARGA
jgi:hypothetical protein